MKCVSFSNITQKNTKPFKKNTKTFAHDTCNTGRGVGAHAQGNTKKEQIMKYQTSEMSVYK